MSSVRQTSPRAAQLDLFRWRQLRESQGPFGSALRLLRDFTRDAFYGLLARCRLAGETEGGHCDFLLLQSSPKVIRLNRKHLLKNALHARGYRLEETSLDEPRALLRARRFRPPLEPVPLRYYAYAAHAQWLAERYAPGILLNDRNGSLYAPFLRTALHRRGGILVHLAHATTLEASRRLDMNDYDYYFLFGRSSLIALQGRANLYGSSTAVLAGSHMIDHSYDLPAANPNDRTLLILGVGPDKEKESVYRDTYEVLRTWAKRDPHYRVLFKAHPRSRAEFWCNAADEHANVSLLAPHVSLAEALSQSSIVVNIMSNAVVEAALSRRPILYVNVDAQHDIFEQDRFIGPRLDSVDAIVDAIAAIELDFGTAVARSNALALHHLASGYAGLETTTNALQALHMRKTPACETFYLSGIIGEKHC